MINFRIIFRITGFLLIVTGILQLCSVPFSLYYQSGDLYDILIAAGITGATGLLLWFGNRQATGKMHKREGYLTVTIGWFSMAIFGTLPYLINGCIPNPADAFFESMSGFTTTGASILNNIEEIPKGILFWRSTSQWIGGMGIIVMTIAIIPMLGIGGMELFGAESPGPTADKIHPRIRETAKRLWLLYVLLTLSETLLLRLGGMSFYDAINHSFTTMATGGYSTYQDSIAHFTSPYIQYVFILFMFFAGTNFTMLYFGFKGDVKKIIHNQEFRTYLGIILVLGTGIGLYIWLQGFSGFEHAMRDSFFQVISLITTTGYVTADYTQWAPVITIMFFFMLFIGGSAGSTGGGVKIIRHLVLIKNSLLEFKRVLHPKGVIAAKINGKIVPAKITTNIMGFVLIYLAVFAIGSLVITAFGNDLETAMGAVATSLGNVGPAIGKVGPVDNFAPLSDSAKWFLSFLMVVGRLELFTVITIFAPSFWKEN